MTGLFYQPSYNGGDPAAAREFALLASIINQQVTLPPTYHAAPPKARVGMIVVADGDDWDPAALATGEPYLVWYDGTAWALPVEDTGAGVTDHGALTGLSDPDHPIAAVIGLQTSLNNLQTQISANAAGINGKISVFRQATPPTATAVGDIWFDTDDGFHQYVWTGSTWTSVQDLQILQNEVDAAQALVDAASAAALADGKITTYYASSDPTGAPDFVVPSEGDLWFDTSSDNEVWRWSVGSAQWFTVQDQGVIQALSDAALAQATADGKIQTFVQASPPTGDLGVGDVWFDSDDDNHVYRYSGSSWVSVRDQLILQASADAAQALADAALAQITADGKVTTFVSTSAPTADGVGDLWLRTTDNHLFRWNGASWVEFQDVDIVQALSDASVAQATADGKITTFYQTSPPTAEGVGDLWVDTDDNNHLYRWSGSAWIDVQDQDAVTALANAAQAIADAATAQATADGKIITFYQASTPTADGVGDLWIRSTDERLFRWNGSSWIEVQDAGITQAIADAAVAQSTADGKIVTFYAASPPTAEGVGDLWIDTGDNDRPYRWNGSSWIDISWINGVVLGEVTFGDVFATTTNSSLLVGTTFNQKDTSDVDYPNWKPLYSFRLRGVGSVNLKVSWHVADNGGGGAIRVKVNGSVQVTQPGVGVGNHIDDLTATVANASYLVELEGQTGVNGLAGGEEIIVTQILITAYKEELIWVSR